MITKSIIRYVVALGMFMSLISCGDKYITVPYTRPAQVNMKDYKAIFVADFNGQYGRDLTFEVKKLLVEMKRFDILESFNSAKNTAAAVLIQGDMVMDEFEEKVKETKNYKDDKGASHSEYTLDGRWFSSVNLKIIEIQSSKMLCGVSLDKFVAISKNDKDRKPVIDKYAQTSLMNDAHRLLAKSIVDLLFPRTEYIKVRMMTDDKLPDLERGITFAEDGDYTNAIDIFSKAVVKTKENEILAKIYYNIGISYQYSFDFTNARKNLKMALSYFDYDLYRKALTNLDKMENDYNEFMKQL